jgi:hypothetical protein
VEREFGSLEDAREPGRVGGYMLGETGENALGGSWGVIGNFSPAHFDLKSIGIGGKERSA